MYMNVFQFPIQEHHSNFSQVVALNSQHFSSGYPGPNCGRNIAIKVNGETVNAKIADNCPGCPYAGLDVTSGLFQEWALLGVGVLPGSWDFICVACACTI